MVVPAKFIPPPQKTNLKMETTKKTMNALAIQADLFLLIFAVLSFVLLIIFKSDYYSHIFNSRFGLKVGLGVGIATAFLTEGVRFSLLVASAADAINGNKKGLILGIIASILITIYDLFICVEVGLVWGSVVHSHILQTFVILGLLLEVRLVLMVNKGGNVGNGQNHQKHNINSNFYQKYFTQNQTTP